jgi:hypothetical protein
LAVGKAPCTESRLSSKRKVTHRKSVNTAAFPGTDAITLADAGLFRALISNSYNYLHDVEGAEIRGNTGKTGQSRVEKVGGEMPAQSARRALLSRLRWE